MKMARGSAKPFRLMRTSAKSRRPSVEPAFEPIARKAFPLWEVFIRSQHGLAHKHVGSLRASDAAMAINNARDVYTRRNEGSQHLGGAIGSNYGEQPQRP